MTDKQKRRTNKLWKDKQKPNKGEIKKRNKQQTNNRRRKK